MLWLLRHAEAADGMPDDQRPLTAAGMRDADAAGRALLRLGVKLDGCLTSPKLRAVQTAERACAPLGVAVTAEPALAGEPFDPEHLTLGLQDALLVGHDPSFTNAIEELTGARVKLAKGGLAVIDRGRLRALLRPAHLAAIAQAQRAAA
jgi:phosphohistidine phosphatase